MLLRHLLSPPQYNATLADTLESLPSNSEFLIPPQSTSENFNTPPGEAFPFSEGV